MGSFPSEIRSPSAQMLPRWLHVSANPAFLRNTGLLGAAQNGSKGIIFAESIPQVKPA